jgi:hypothetical protein
MKYNHLSCLRPITIDQNTDFCFVTTEPAMNSETSNAFLTVKNYHYTPILSSDTIRMKVRLTYMEVM